MYKSKLDTRIQEERLEILVQNLPLSILSTILVSTFMFYIVMDKVSLMTAIIWLILILTLSLSRISHIYRMKRNESISYLEEERKIILGIFLSGTLFGSSVLVIFPDKNMATQALSFFLLSSMIAGSVALYTTHIISFKPLYPLCFPFLS